MLLKGRIDGGGAGRRPAVRSVEKQRRGGGRLEEEERPDKRARPVSERGEGEGEVVWRRACWAGRREEGSWAAQAAGPRAGKKGKGRGKRGLGVLFFFQILFQTFKSLNSFKTFSTFKLFSKIFKSI
jgi:hypothetical protein